MRVEFFRPPPPTPEGEDAPPPEAVAVVSWREGHPVVESADDAVRSQLEGAFRPTPVLTDDAAYRRLGAHGAAVIGPGSLRWFMTVAQVRAPAETGLHPRFDPGPVRGGYDPAAGYRTFDESMERVLGGDPV